MKRPRKDEIAFVLRSLRHQAKENRTHARRNREKVSSIEERYREYFLVLADRQDTHAERFERVAAWIETL